MAELINEIISPEAFKQVADMKAELASLTKQMEDMLKKMNNPALGGKSPFLGVPEEIERTKEEMRQLQIVKNKIITTEAKLNDEYVQQAARLKELNSELRANVAQTGLAEGSLDQMRNNLNKLEKLYSAMSAEMRNAKVGQTIFADMVKAKEGVTLLEQSMGNYKRNVGNYTNATFQLSQVLREMPAFTYSAQTGFMALSNNLPMLADAFQQVRKETGSTGAALGIFAKSIGSFSNVFTIAITAVTMMIPALTKMFTAMDDTTQSSAKLKDELKSVTQIMNDEISKATSLTEIITNQNVAYLDRTLAFDQLKKAYPDLLKDMTMEQAINERALDTYGGLIASITVMAQRKAKLAEYEKLIAEQSALQLKYDQARGSMDEKGTFTYTDSGQLQELKMQLDKTTNMVEAYRDKMEREGEALNDSFKLIKGGGKKTDEKGNKANQPFKPEFQIDNNDYDDIKKYFSDLEKAFEDAWKEQKPFFEQRILQDIEDSMTLTVAPTLPDSQANDLNAQLLTQAKNRQAKTETDKKALDDYQKKLEQVGEAIRKVTEGINAIGDLASSFIDRKLQEIDMQQKKMEDYYDAEKIAVEQLSISQEEKTKRLAALEAQRGAQQKKIDAERLQAERKQAAIQKGINIANIIGATALAIITQFTALPVATQIPRSIIAGAIGGVQLAAAIAAPLPQFAKGTDNAPEGFAVVGERGTELVVNPDGTSWLTPAKDTITYLKQGAKVIPNNELIDMVKYANYVNVGGIKQGETGGLFGMALVSKFDELADEVRGLKMIMANKNMNVQVSGNYDHYLHVRKNIR